MISFPTSHPVPLYGGRAQRRGGQGIQEYAATLFALATPRRGFLCHFRAFLFVIAREHRDRGDPVIIKSHAFACVHYLLDCFAALRMTNMMKYILPGPCGQKAPHKNIRFCGDPAPRGDKKYPYMIFLLQDILQTNRINIKHVPNPNHRLD